MKRSVEQIQSDIIEKIYIEILTWMDEIDVTRYANDRELHSALQDKINSYLKEMDIDKAIKSTLPIQGLDGMYYENIAHNVRISLKMAPGNPFVVKINIKSKVQYKYVCPFSLPPQPMPASPTAAELQEFPELFPPAKHPGFYEPPLPPVPSETATFEIEHILDLGTIQQVKGAIEERLVIHNRRRQSMYSGAEMEGFPIPTYTGQYCHMMLQSLPPRIPQPVELLMLSIQRHDLLGFYVLLFGINEKISAEDNESINIGMLPPDTVRIIFDNLVGPRIMVTDCNLLPGDFFETIALKKLEHNTASSSAQRRGNTPTK